jgi:DNA invertase Pin-like site-specific DNA recombinase
MSQLGTLAGYSQRVSKSKYTPPSSEVEEHVTRVVGLFKQRQEVEDAYRLALAELTSDDGVPIAYIAEQLGVERKTVYRHLGRSMT